MLVDSRQLNTQMFLLVQSGLFLHKVDKQDIQGVTLVQRSY